MLITPLSVSDRQRQLDTFVDFFVKEFIAEIGYLEDIARGNRTARTDASLAMMFNIACALVSLAPIPGGVLAFVALPHVLKVVTQVVEAGMQNELAQSAINASSSYIMGSITGNIQDKLTVKEGASGSISIEDNTPIDIESLSVLARWLGVQLARRYEQVLTERLSTQPDKAIVGLARVGARRCLAYLAGNPLPSGDPKERTEYLLSGVLMGAPMPWYQRPLKWIKSGESLAGRNEAEKISFVAENLFVNGAWIKGDATDKVKCKTHTKTEWLPAAGLFSKSSPLAGLPKYGYVVGFMAAPGFVLKTSSSAPELLEWQCRRLQQPITRKNMMDYLASAAVTVAKKEHRTATITLSQFLYAQSPRTFPQNAQPILSDDLSDLVLTSGNFQGVDFSGSQFCGDLSHTSFESARLYACCFTEVSSDANSTVNFAQAALGFSTLLGARYAGNVNMTQADLTCVDFTNTAFGSVDHLGAIWHKTVLTGVNYNALRDAQKVQVTELAAEQAQQGDQLNAMNQKIQALEAKMAPLFAQNTDSAEREQLEALLLAQVNRLQFEAYATEKLDQLQKRSDLHGEAIHTLNATLLTVREECIMGERQLQTQIDQLSQRVDHLETRARRNSEDKLTMKAAQQTTQKELTELRGALALLMAQGLSSTASAEEREAYLEKSAIAKILTEYDKALSQKLQDLVYYVRPDVVDHVPDSMSSAEYVSKVEAGEIENKTRPLLSEVDNYLQSNDQVMLLLGDPGAGKSLFSWYSTQSRLQQYQRVLQNLEPGDTPWLPVVIELKNYSLSELTNLLPRYLKETCHITSEEQIAIQNDRQPKHRILLVLDGFDELKQEADGDTEEVKRRFKDCVEACGAGAWFAGQIKVVVTCRLRHLADTSIERQYFGRGLKKEFRRRVVLPFSSAQIATYLAERTETQMAESHLLPAATYLSVMDASSSIKAMVRNPFVLRLFVDALPELQKQGRDLNATKRYDIYEAFVTQWFEREIGRFNPAHQAALGVQEHGAERAVSKQFARYAGMLAIQMYQHDSLVVRYDDSGSNDAALQVWNRLDETITNAEMDEASMTQAIEASVREEYNKLKASDKKLLQVRHKIKTVEEYVAYKLPKEELEKRTGEKAEQVVAQLEAFKISSPLRKSGNNHSFIHKSFYEFFLAQSILQNAGADQPLATRVANTLMVLCATTGHESRRIQYEPQALLFLQDIWIGNSTDPLIERVKETFFAVIEASKGHPEHGAAAANAITMLNWMGTMLMRQSWQGIQIPGANLAHAQLMGSDLTQANLRGARLFRAQLQEVTLSQANLTDVEFMERAPITTKSTNSVIAYHPTRPWIAIADGSTVRQYDTEREVFIDELLTGSVTCISYSPSGLHLAIGSADKTIRQWVVVTGEPFGPVLAGHTNRVNSVSYSPSGLYLASGSFDNTIRQWVAATGEPFGPVLLGHTNWVHSVCYSPSGLHLASGSADKTIRQWVAATGEVFGSALKGHTQEVTSVCYSPLGTHLASSSFDSTVRQWVASIGEPFGPVLTGHTGRVISVSYSPSGTYLASGGHDNAIRQWVTSTGELYGPVFEGHTEWINSVSYSPSGMHLASTSWDKTVRQWALSNIEPFGPILEGHTGEVNSVSYSPSGTYLASGSTDKTIRQWVVATGELFGSVLKGHKGWINSVSYSPSGTYLASAGVDQTMRQWVAASSAPFGPFLNRGEGEVNSVSYSPFGMHLAGNSDDGIRQWVAATGEPFGPVLEGHTDQVRSVVYSPDGKTLASGSSDSTIRQWVAATGEPFGLALKGHKGMVLSVSYSPSGTHLVSGGWDYTIRQWVAVTGKPFGPVLAGHTDRVTSVSYSPSGLHLASGSYDKTIRQWVAATGEPFGPVLAGHINQINSVSYSPSGMHLAGAGLDFKIYVWNSGMAGDFSLLWCTRSGANPLMTFGLRLRGAVGLRADQLALLAYSGYTEPAPVSSTSAAIVISNNSSTIFAQKKTAVSSAEKGKTSDRCHELDAASEKAEPSKRSAAARGAPSSSTAFSVVTEASAVSHRSEAVPAGSEASIAKATQLHRRFVAPATFKMLKKQGANATITPVTKNEFKSREFYFDVSVDIIKTLADFYFGEKKHNIDRGKQFYSSILFGKINLSKELKRGTSSTSEVVTGKTIFNILKKCEGALFDSDQRNCLHEVVDVALLNALIETEQHSRGLEAILVHKQAAKDSASPT